MNYRQRKSHLTLWVLLVLIIPVAFYGAERSKPIYQRLAPEPVELDGPDKIMIREFSYRSESVFAIVRGSIGGKSDMVLIQEEPISIPGVVVLIAWNDDLKEMKYIGPLGSKYMENYEIPPLANPFFRKIVLYSIVEDRVVKVIRPLFK